jgi:protein-tyrosine phosphatase
MNKVAAPAKYGKPLESYLALSDAGLYHHESSVSKKKAGSPRMPDENVKTIIFVCTANYYRSRFSEHLFNRLAEAHGLRWRATSRGLRTWMADGYGPIASFTVDRQAARGIHLNGNIRFPVPLSEADLRSADLVVAMKEAEHRAMMQDQFPAWADRIEYWHVDDIDCAPPDDALPVCEACVEALVERLAGSEPGACLSRSVEGQALHLHHAEGTSHGAQASAS